jgi:hypothetical protein
MQFTERHLTRHYAQLAQKLREYFPAADRRVIVEYVEALRVYDLLPTPPALDRLITAHHLISSTLPIIELES